jgi:hypothetical protein
MAQTKQKLKVIYHTFICDDNLGEADGFFEINDGKLQYVTSWDCNDASWRGEYMRGLLKHVGVDVQTLPDKYKGEASKLMAKAYGLDEGEDEGGVEERDREEAVLGLRKGTSDKVYHLSLFEGGATQRDGGWYVEALYGRRGSNLRLETKCEGEDYNTAKKIYDKVLKEKLKKGYK